MQKNRIKAFEILLILIAVSLLSSASYVLITDFPLRYYLFNLSEDDGQVPVGSVAKTVGSLKRQLTGQGEFKSIGPNSILFNRDYIVTGGDSGTTVQLDNGGSIELGPNTMVRLAFERELSLDGIKRSQRLEVVSGKVSGRAGSQKILISTKDKNIELAPNREESLEVIPTPKGAKTRTKVELTKPTPAPTARKPTPVAPSPSPSPKPSPSPTMSLTPEELNRIRIISPKLKERLRIPAGSTKPILNVNFKWSVYPANTLSMVSIWRYTSTQDITKSKPLFSKQIKTSGLLSGLQWIAPSPGWYVWRVSGVPGNQQSLAKTLSGMFYAEEDFQAISVGEPLVSGKLIRNNRLEEKLIKDFYVSLKWSGYPPATRYDVIFGADPELKKEFFRKSVGSTHYNFNKNKIINGMLYYQIRTRLSNGYSAVSLSQKFGFEFLPPRPVTPQPMAEIPAAELAKNRDQLLLTWEKTNFTQKYEIELAADPGFQTILAKLTIQDNFVFLSKLKAGTYWWRVRSISAHSASAMSEGSQFTIRP